jgi:hypothetical protein
MLCQQNYYFKKPGSKTNAQSYHFCFDSGEAIRTPKAFGNCSVFEVLSSQLVVLLKKSPKLRQPTVRCN